MDVLVDDELDLQKEFTVRAKRRDPQSMALLVKRNDLPSPK